MLEQVRVLNNEIHTHYAMTVRPDRLYQFYEVLLRDWQSRTRLAEKDLTSGVAAPAVTGLSTIFTNIPHKFPILDLLAFLKEDAAQKYELGDITLVEIDAALAKFGQTVPLLQGDGSEI